MGVIRCCEGCGGGGEGLRPAAATNMGARERGAASYYALTEVCPDG